jgi:uncharacterized protein (TIGR03435 family)
MLSGLAATILTFFAFTGAFCQAVPSPVAFEAASIKPSRSVTGNDGTVTTDPGRFIARNATLKRLIFEAWRIPYSQISGGPAWLDRDEYDIDAKAENPASLAQIRLMLRALLIDRFKLAVRVERKQTRVYALMVGKGGPRLGLEHGESPGVWRFHGDLSEFANVLAIRLTIPMSISDNPAIPSRASGAPVPIVNKTGIEGVYDISVDIKPDQGSDTFTIWQRALQEQLGLKLEAQKGAVEFLVVEHAERF